MSYEILQHLVPKKLNFQLSKYAVNVFHVNLKFVWIQSFFHIMLFWVAKTKLKPITYVLVVTQKSCLCCYVFIGKESGKWNLVISGHSRHVEDFNTRRKPAHLNLSFLIVSPKTHANTRYKWAPRVGCPMWCNVT